jgi:hypothetical protein
MTLLDIFNYILNFDLTNILYLFFAFLYFGTALYLLSIAFKTISKKGEKILDKIVAFILIALFFPFTIILIIGILVHIWEILF